jgi:hypothetical protein
MACRNWIPVFMGLILLVGFPAYGQEHSLYWRDLDVHARLDQDGRLHVTERHAIVFTGDWNGGQRQFDLSVDQYDRVNSFILTKQIESDYKSLWLDL